MSTTVIPLRPYCAACGDHFQRLQPGQTHCQRCTGWDRYIQLQAPATDAFRKLQQGIFR